MPARAIWRVVLVGAFALAIALVLTDPVFLRLIHGRPAAQLAGAADLANGKTIFNIGGCASCHASPGQADRLRLGGGLALNSPFGTFYAPNISPHPRDGIGAWSVEAFLRAMREGVSPDGQHYFPAFPYTSYQRMADKDVADLFGFIRTLAPVEGRVRAHDVAFPFNIRRLLGGWKLLFLDGQPFRPEPAKDAIVNRGAYLVEGPGHCAECHSPRNVIGGIVSSRRLAGGPDPEGKGHVPNITPHKDGIADWSAADMAEFLESGVTPDFNKVGRSMSAVIRNTAQLSPEDRQAMAAYLKGLAPIAGRSPALTKP